MTSSSSHHKIVEPDPIANPIAYSPLPQSYGQTQIVLLPRDPFCVFVYWEITFDTLQHVQNQYGPLIFSHAQPILRFYELNEDHDIPLNSFDVPISMQAQSWYVHLPREGKLWMAEIGFLLKDGFFICLAGSRRLAMPKISVDLSERARTMQRQDWSRNFLVHQRVGSSENFLSWAQQDNSILRTQSSWQKAFDPTCKRDCK